MVRKGEAAGSRQTTGRNTWRNPSTHTAWYLNTLAEWGYTLCPVERIASKLTDDTATAPLAGTEACEG